MVASLDECILTKNLILFITDFHDILQKNL